MLRFRGGAIQHAKLSQVRQPFNRRQLNLMEGDEYRESVWRRSSSDVWLLFTHTHERTHVGGPGALKQPQGIFAYGAYVHSARSAPPFWSHAMLWAGSIPPAAPAPPLHMQPDRGDSGKHTHAHTVRVKQPLWIIQQLSLSPQRFYQALSWAPTTHSPPMWTKAKTAPAWPAQTVTTSSTSQFGEMKLKIATLAAGTHSTVTHDREKGERGRKMMMTPLDEDMCLLARRQGVSGPALRSAVQTSEWRKVKKK